MTMEQLMAMQTQLMQGMTQMIGHMQQQMGNNPPLASQRTLRVTGVETF
jgi:hypothetical protein